MLNTNLKHIESDAEFQKVLNENENVMICCGREGPMCLPVYDIMENFESKYENVAFRDMRFDGPAAHNIKSLPEVRFFTGLPFTVYFQKGKVVAATTSIQTKSQVREILDREFGKGSSKAA
jgi:thioredoxin 1